MTSIAIVGLHSEDFISGLISEIDLLKNKVEITSISDQNEDLLLEYQRLYNIKKLYTDTKDHILTESPEILIISIKPGNLENIISIASEKRPKGIILDKPIATSFELSQKISDQCRLNNTNLIVNYKKRWDPLYQNVKNIIESKTLGKLVSISGNLNNHSAKVDDYQTVIKEFGGGDLLYNGSDLIDLIRYFSGEVESINSTVKREKSNYGAETHSYSILNMHSGVIAYMKTNNISKYNSFELDLSFKKGRIRVGKDLRKFYKIVKNKDRSLMSELVESEAIELTDKNHSSGSLNEMIQSLNKQVLPESSGLNALKNMEIALGIYYSAYLGGNTVNLPLKVAGNPLKKMFQSDMI